MAPLIVVSVLKPWVAGGNADSTLRPAVLAETAAPAPPIPTEDRTSEGLASDFRLGAGPGRLRRWRPGGLWLAADVEILPPAVTAAPSPSAGGAR